MVRQAFLTVKLLRFDLGSFRPKCLLAHGMSLVCQDFEMPEFFRFGRRYFAFFLLELPFG